jgi:hypothetical protein
MPSTNSSTLTGLNLIQYARTFDWAIPTVGLAGYDTEPALSFIQDIVQRLMNRNNPWKWNSYLFPLFYTQPYQQDYPTSISQNQLGWLEHATFIDINNATEQPPIQPPIQCVARLLPTSNCGIPSEICWIPNRVAILGTWPGNNITYLNPLVSLGGGPGSNPLTAILDPNGNIQVVTTYGTTVASGIPTWPIVGAQAGVQTMDGTVVWTVQDPNGVAIRVNALATNDSQVWEMHVAFQQKPPIITSISQTLAPIPDDLGYLIKQGFLAYCWKKADKKTFQLEYAEWMENIQEAMGASDREPQSFGIYPADSLQGAGGNPASGYGYVGWPGWSSNGW